MNEDQVEAEARAVAHGLIQGYLGPDHKVINMRAIRRWCKPSRLRVSRGRRIADRYLDPVTHDGTTP